MITPKQAYEAAKVLWPDVERIEQSSTRWILKGCTQSAKIDWGDTDQYPPPEPEWVDAVFPQDVGKEGRFSNDRNFWVCGTICGRWQTSLWVSSDFSWKFCQVRKVKT